ncbi:MAG: PQQ-binding-like beta-propeller repeat protein [Vulcanimicrobiota bacterium]
MRIDSQIGLPRSVARPAVAATGPIDTVELGRETPVKLTRAAVAALVGQTSKELKPLWNREISDVVGPDYPEIQGAPVIATDGKRAFFASQHALLALDSKTGATGWSFDADGKGIASRPLVHGDQVLVSALDGRVYALDSVSGTPAWSAPCDHPAGLQLGADGSIVVGVKNGQLGLDPTTGEQLWSSPVPFGDSAVGLNNQIVRAGDQVRAAVAYDRDSGEEQWRFSQGGLIRHRPTVGPDGTVYVGDTDGKFFALDPATGQPRWIHQTEGYVLEPSTVSADGQTVYVGSSDQHLYALDTATGDPRWKCKVEGEVRMQPNLSGQGTVVLASDKNKIYVVDEATGSPLASAPAASYVHVAPAAGGDSLVLQANNHTLYGFGSPTGLRSQLSQAMQQADAPTMRLTSDAEAVHIGEVDVPIQP